MAKTLKELREMYYPSQADFARAVGVSKATACGWETGKREPNIQQMLIIAKLLRVSKYVVFDAFVANINDSE